MTNANQQWVGLPNFLCLNSSPINYQDSLIYLTLRSFLNTATSECFPAYETIAKRAGVSRDFVIDSIKRLKAGNLIRVETSKFSRTKNNPNNYRFDRFYSFEEIPVSFFEDKMLTRTEKAMLICLRQFFNHGVLTSIYTISQMAYYLGLTYRTVHAQFTRLLSKGYIMQIASLNKKGEVYSIQYKLTNRIDWIHSHNTDRRQTIAYPRLKIA